MKIDEYTNAPVKQKMNYQQKKKYISIRQTGCICTVLGTTFCCVACSLLRMHVQNKTHDTLA